MSYTCESCGAEYISRLAATECQDDDDRADLNNRQWIAAQRKGSN